MKELTLGDMYDECVDLYSKAIYQLFKKVRKTKQSKITLNTRETKLFVNAYKKLVEYKFIEFDSFKKPIVAQAVTNALKKLEKS